LLLVLKHKPTKEAQGFKGLWANSAQVEKNAIEILGERGIVLFQDSQNLDVLCFAEALELGQKRLPSFVLFG